MGCRSYIGGGEGQLKKRMLLILIVLASVLIVIGFVVFLTSLEDKKKDQLINLLEQFPKNEQVAFIGDGQVYLNDRNILSDAIEGYDVEDFLYVSKNSIFFYTLTDNNKTVNVYLFDYKIEEIKKIFSNTYNTHPQPYMTDERFIYIMEEEYYRYDIETKETVKLGDTFEAMKQDFASHNMYSFEKQEEDFNGKNTSFSIVRKEDGFSKTVSTADILKNADASLINDIYPLQLFGLVFEEEKIYLLCKAHYSISLVFQFDFDSEQIIFFTWKEVLDTEGLRFFLIEE